MWCPSHQHESGRWNWVVLPIMKTYKFGATPPSPNPEQNNGKSTTSSSFGSNRSRSSGGRLYQDGSPRKEGSWSVVTRSPPPLEDQARCVNTRGSALCLPKETPSLQSRPLISSLFMFNKTLPTTAPFHPRNASRRPELCILPVPTGSGCEAVILMIFHMEKQGVKTPTTRYVSYAPPTVATTS